jgi:hypothetical protein
MRKTVAKTKRCGKTRKVSYRDEASARRAVKNAKRFFEDSELTPERVYQCPLCGHWHLTSEAVPK